jgi:hypothetical protein
MVANPTTISVEPDGELARILQRAAETPVLIETRGARYRVTREDDDAFGSLTGVDVDSLLAELREQRAQDSKGRPSQDMDDSLDTDIVIPFLAALALRGGGHRSPFARLEDGRSRLSFPENWTLLRRWRVGARTWPRSAEAGRRGAISRRPACGETASPGKRPRCGGGPGPRNRRSPAPSRPAAGRCRGRRPGSGRARDTRPKGRPRAGSGPRRAPLTRAGNARESHPQLCPDISPVG